MKKKLVLVALFVLPIVAYLFFASGVYNFANLPLMSKEVMDVAQFSSKELKGSNPSKGALSLNNKITLLGYLGDGFKENPGYTANLNLMIYKYFERYEDFQLVLFVSEGNATIIEGLKEELERIFNTSKMRFIVASKSEIEAQFNSLDTNLSLMSDGGHPFVFIIDKERSLRSGHQDKKGNEYGYDFTQAVEMGYLKDDIKILLAEYRLALKKNNNASPKIEQRRELTN